jgi:2-C-methyl-D-erythritol 4-phosphate cytidylyltransferase
MIAAVLPAAGAGERFKTKSQDTPKQFIGLDGRPLYIWSLTTLANHTGIDTIVVVVPGTSLDLVQEEIKHHLPPHLSKKIILTAGGSTRQDSVRNGLERLAQLSQSPSYVLVHDAARPLLTSQMVDNVIASVTANGACTLAVPVTDTVKKVKNGLVGETLDRSELVQIQTPQAAKFEWLLEAHRKAARENFGTTHDSTILEHSGHKVHIVSGSPYNLKITNPEDLSLCQSLAFALDQRS